MIKKLLFKKEWEKIEKEKKEYSEKLGLFIKWEEEEKRQLEIDKKRFEAEKSDFYRIGQKEYGRQIQERLKKEYQKQKKRLQEIYDYKIFPGAKVWVFEGFGTLASKPVEVEIERVIFEKDNIRVDDWSRFFFTEQEAIKAHNKEIKKLLLK